MTDLEDRLRRDLRKVGERATEDSIRPLRIPPPRKMRRTVRWLAPVAAVAAVIGVIAGVSLTTGSARVTAPRFTAPRPEPAAPDVMPPYYVVLQEGQVPGHAPQTTATVRDSLTGAALTSVQLPQLEPGSGRAISAAADDRTFLITDGNDLYLLRLSANGRSAGFTRLGLSLPTSNGTAQASAALSPDGTTVAIASQSSCAAVTTNSGVDASGCGENTIRIVSLVTGATRTWSTHELWQPVLGVSWDGDDHLLFSWANAGPSGPQASGYRLLNIGGDGGNLLAAQKLPLPPLPTYGPVTYGQSAFVTPDEGAVIISTFTVTDPDNGNKNMQVLELSISSGKVVRVLYQATEGATDLPVLYEGEGCSVLALGPGGVHALIECTILTQTVFGRVDDGRFTPLPGIPYLGSTIIATAAW